MSLAVTFSPLIALTHLGGIDSRLLFTALFTALAAERLAELVRSRANVRRALARGGELAPEPWLWPAMVAMHTLFLVLPPLEVFLLSRPFVPALSAVALAASVAAMALRRWAMAALGERWTTRVIAVPGEPVVTTGPYRFLRHPNYLAVVVELAALPLVHGAWLSSLGFTVGNALLLACRIRSEEALLSIHADYAERLGGRARLLPRLRDHRGDRGD